MAISAFKGPMISFGQTPSGTGLDYNEEMAPSLFSQGLAFMDPRLPYTYQPGQAVGNMVSGFYMGGFYNTLNITPAAAGAATIAAAANVVSGTAMTLVSSSANGVVVGQSLLRADTGALVTGLRAIGQSSGILAYNNSGATQYSLHTIASGSGPSALGLGQTIQLWDPTTLTARAVSITCNNASGTGGAMTVRGYDIYGYPMAETITIAPGSALTVRGKKAFKYIASVTPAFTDATYTYSIGTTDIFGLPLASTYITDSMIWLNSILQVQNAGSPGGYTAGVNTAATATTGDVRGTLDVAATTGFNVASDGTKRFTVWQSAYASLAPLANGTAGTNTGMFGVAQYSA